MLSSSSDDDSSSTYDYEFDEYDAGYDEVELPFSESKELKFKTLSSIPKDSKEYKAFKSYIEIEQILFSSIFPEEMYKQFVSIIQQNEKNQNIAHLCKYLIDLLIYFIKIRPKQKEVACLLLSKIILNYPNFHFINVIETIKQNNNYRNNMIVKDALYSKIIVSKISDNYQHSKGSFSSYYKETLNFLLEEDDLIQLKNYINTKIDDIPNEIELPEYSPVKEVIDLIRINIVDYCCFYGSIKCYKFLTMNGYNFGNYITEMAVAGGNFEIIHDIEQKGLYYTNCFHISVQFHHNLVSEWLLSNYYSGSFSIRKCVKYLNYQAFLFLYLNEECDSRFDIPQLHYLFKQDEINTEAIQSLLEANSNINKSFKKSSETLTHLGALFQQKECTVDNIKDLISKGANLNKNCKKYVNDEHYVTFPPIYYLIQQRNIEAIKFIIENGMNIYGWFEFYKSKFPSLCFSVLGCLCLFDEINMELVQYFPDECFDIRYGLITPLGCLCLSNNVDIKLIQYFIDKGADLNQGAITPLLCLCIVDKPNIDLVKFLLDNGADINKVSREYFENKSDIIEFVTPIKENITPLGYLFKQDDINIELVKFLLDYGADVNKGHITPLGYLCKHKEINIELIHILLEHNADVNKICIKIGIHITPLAFLCKRKHLNIEAVHVLLDAGADVNLGDTPPLAFLLQQKEINYEAINLLIDKSANLNRGFIFKNNRTIYTPLSYLLRKINTNIQLIQFLLDRGADVNQYFEYESSSKCSALGYLIQQEKVNIELINLLLDYGADVNQEFIIEEDYLDIVYTPFFYICSRNDINYELIQLFIDKGANINHECEDTNFRKYTPLCYLCCHKNVDIKILKYFLDHGADVNKGDFTPLCCLCYNNGNIEALKLLLDNGAEVNTGYFTPLCCLCDRKNVNISAIEILLNQGADINKESLGYTPLGYLCKRENKVNIKAIQFLLDNGADINKGLISPLGFLCKQNDINIEAIHLLINRGADVNIGCHYDKYNVKNIFTPLALLCLDYEHNIKAIQLLLDNGADPNKKCTFNVGHHCTTCTPLAYLSVTQGNNEEASELLTKYGALKMFG